MRRRDFLVTGSLAGCAAITTPLHVGRATGRPSSAMSDGRIDDLLEDVVDAAERAGATWAEARMLVTRQRSLQLRKEDVWNVGTSATGGIAVRVYANGGWGFVAAGDPSDVDPKRVAGAAVALATSSATLGRQRFLPDRRLTRGRYTWTTPGARDPFAPSDSELIALLSPVTARALRSDRIAFAVANFFATGRELRYRNSDDVRVEQTRVAVWPNFAVTAFDQRTGRIDNRASRTVPAAGGMERVLPDALLEEVDVAVREALEMQAAPTLTPMRYDVILEASHHWKCIADLLAPHLDPWSEFGVDGRNPAHRTVRAGMRQQARLASQAMTLQYDGALAGGLASGGFDDAGRPAMSGVVIDAGVFQGFPVSDDLASAAPVDLPAGGTLHAPSWQAPPRFAMPDLAVPAPNGARSVDEMIRDTQLGVLLRGKGRITVSTDRSWFRATAEQAWLIVNGERKHMVRDVEYESTIASFFNALAEIGRDDEAVTGGDLFPVGGSARWEAPFSVRTPPARYLNIPLFSTAREASR